MTPSEKITAMIEKHYKREQEKWHDGFKNNFSEWEDLKEEWDNFQSLAKYKEAYYNLVRVLRKEGLDDAFAEYIIH